MVKAPLNDWFEKRDKRVQELRSEIISLKEKYGNPNRISALSLRCIGKPKTDEYHNLCKVLRGIAGEAEQWIDIEVQSGKKSFMHIELAKFHVQEMSAMEFKYGIPFRLSSMEHIREYALAWLEDLEKDNLPVPTPYTQSKTPATLPASQPKPLPMKAFCVSDLTEQEKKQVYQYVIKRDFAVSDLTQEQRNQVYQEVMREKRAKRTRKQHDIHAKALAHYHREAERTKQETGKAISKNAFAAQYCKQYKCVESTLREWLKEK